jgi:seryl-tRNA synthetase
MRTHQFDKVEMFVYCQPEDAARWHDRILAIEEEIYQALEIPYRVMLICTGDLGPVAAKKNDIEAWKPSDGVYREITSTSNCTDFQARGLNTRYRPEAGGKPVYVHMLNGTATAIGRTLAMLLENHQQEDGSVVLPAALRPHLPAGLDVLSSTAH